MKFVILAAAFFLFSCNRSVASPLQIQPEFCLSEDLAGVQCLPGREGTVPANSSSINSTIALLRCYAGCLNNEELAINKDNIDFSQPWPYFNPETLPPGDLENLTTCRFRCAIVLLTPLTAIGCQFTCFEPLIKACRLGCTIGGQILASSSTEKKPPTPTATPSAYFDPDSSEPWLISLNLTSVVPMNFSVPVNGSRSVAAIALEFVIPNGDTNNTFHYSMFHPEVGVILMRAFLSYYRCSVMYLSVSMVNEFGSTPITPHVRSCIPGILKAAPTPTPTPTSISPSKVQGVTVTRTSQGSHPSVTVSLSVSWSAVSGSGITYTVCYSTTLGTKSDPPSDANCDASGISRTSTTLGPLIIGTTYYIWVAAVSSDGQGPYSDREQETTYRVPTRMNPPRLTKTVSSGRPALRVTWTASSSDEHLITKYQVQYRRSGNTSWRVNDVASTFTTLANLSAGTSYQVRVRAVSDIGVGSYSETRTITTYRLPSQAAPPVLTKAVSSSRPALRVTWTTPSSERPITKYEVGYRMSGGTSWIPKNVVSTSITLENLSAGTNYQVRVRAVSDVGAGLYSPIGTKTTYRVPEQVTGVGFKLDNTSNVLTLTITWDRPSSELPITHYFVRIAETQRQLRVDGATTLTIPATRGSAYTFSVIAVSAVGFGEWSESVTAEPTCPPNHFVTTSNKTTFDDRGAQIIMERPLCIPCMDARRGSKVFCDYCWSTLSPTLLWSRALPSTGGMLLLWSIPQNAASCDYDGFRLSVFDLTTGVPSLVRQVKVNKSVRAFFWHQLGKGITYHFTVQMTRKGELSKPLTVVKSF